MRWDWIPLSASALVVGVMALAFGALLNPVPADGDSAQTVATVAMAGGRWLGMAVMYFLASVTLTLGLPAVLSLFHVRARALGVIAVSVLSIGFIGTSGYAMLLVFFRALVREQAIRAGTLDTVTEDVGLGIFLFGWLAAFYAGLTLLALALFVARRTPVWVPLLVLLFVALFPVIDKLGRVGQVAQVVALAFAFTGIAMAAVHDASGRARAVEVARSGSAPVF
ncbi:hypothetical protein [Nocardioides iriomotensis]|uniref:DUF4386 family protein n=1 Tax=Nocardioides iriomotensis TaxID=715784 RepID=A0A4Q5JAC9_9ACTN|nr:hypothetical protein [Nocardioides iriomotensis]RYU15594.1 hypothetical protein ETU37_00280 [Nocardioides iriomotensis]